MTGCSNALMLTLLLDEQLGEDAQARLVDHVESCTDCQARLKELTSSPSQIIDTEQIRRSLGDPLLTIDYPILGLDAAARTDRSGRKPLDGRAEGPAADGEFPVVEGYQFLSVLGHGGMGVVYKARQEKLNRCVALKMIRAGNLAGPEDLARFRIEAEVMARQRHPHIIQIFDIGEAGGLPYVALELLDGGSLDTRLGGSPQPGSAAAGLLATLARAVHAAHRAGIIHRDLKPSNVLFDSGGTPRITDFGLAKRLEEDGYTATGQVLGSPSYIPPEQALGQAKDVGPAADIYALGAILYEMLTGRPPFKGMSAVETVMQVIHDDPVPPSSLQNQVPRDLETICLKCLEKEPGKRYATAQDLADDLDRYLSDRPIQARPTPALERGLKWARRRPIASFLMAFGGVLLAMLVGTGLWLEAEHRGKRRPD